MYAQIQFCFPPTGFSLGSISHQEQYDTFHFSDTINRRQTITILIIHRTINGHVPRPYKSIDAETLNLRDEMKTISRVNVTREPPTDGKLVQICCLPGYPPSVCFRKSENPLHETNRRKTADQDLAIRKNNPVNRTHSKRTRSNRRRAIN